MGTRADWIAACPSDARTPEYATHLLGGVVAGVVTCAWLPVVSSYGGARAVFYVSDDALRVTREDGSRFRPQVSAELLQRIADHVKAILPTSKICDLAYEQADVVLDAELEPTLTPEQQAKMSKLVDSFDYNDKVERDRAGREGLIRDCGKTWLLSNLLTQGALAVNYGFYSKGAPNHGTRGHAMWQTRGTRHNGIQFDYSQTGILLSDECEYAGQVVSTTALLRGDFGTVAAALGTDEGPLRVTRQPGVLMERLLHEARSRRGR